MSGFLILGAGIMGGLSRIGAGIDSPARLIDMHGALMVCGFLGTVISLERAVALNKIWGYLSPFFSAIGGAGLIFGFIPVEASFVLFTGSSVFLSAIFVSFLLIRLDPNILIMLVGALYLTAGNIFLFLGYPPSQSILLWMVFLICTIAAERLELSAFLARSRIQVYSLRLFLTAAGISAFFPGSFKGGIVFSTSILCIAFWLVYFDIVRKNIWKEKLVRFIAVCILSGYIWLIASAVFHFIYLQNAGIFYRDAFLHSFFMGFIFLLIFGHAPIIFTSILGVESVYSPVFYGHFVLLNASLALRIIGDVVSDGQIRMMGGAGSAAAVGLFLIVTMPVVLRKALRG